jgi:phosphopantetheinyl transferase (holo-ACP synthase)
MISAGNDIVSLTDIDIDRTIKPAFYSKILTATEYTLYADVSDQITLANFVWLLWSVKEAAYKYLHRLQPNLVFSPVKFRVSTLSPPVGTSGIEVSRPIEMLGFAGNGYWQSALFYDLTELSAFSIVSPQLIHSVAGDKGSLSQVRWGIKQIETSDPKMQSAEVRTFLMSRLQSLFPGDTSIQKNSSCVPVAHIGSGAIIPVSLSHHGRFVSYSF